jgi:hypothetical protein
MHVKQIISCVGKFYLADAGYALKPGFLPPYKAVRYYMSEFQGRRSPSNAKELFNLRHSSLITIVERAFGALKGRFRIMDNKPFYPYPSHVKIVLACCILHNWIFGFGVDEVITGDDFIPPPSHNQSFPTVAAMSQEVRAWSDQRDQWALAMWENRGSSRV